MEFIARLLAHTVQRALLQQQNILLIGPKGVGKSSLLNYHIATDLSYSLSDLQTRLHIQQNPQQLLDDIVNWHRRTHSQRLPIVWIDELQKAPQLIAEIQYAMEYPLAIFIVTLSSWVIKGDTSILQELRLQMTELSMHGVSIDESRLLTPALTDLLLYGQLPYVLLQTDTLDKEKYLQNYVNDYLVTEVRSEGLVRNLAKFSKFFRYAAIYSGEAVNANYLSKEIGATRATINEYYQILERSMLVEAIQPLTTMTVKRRLSRTIKYIWSDLGVRRLAAEEGDNLPEKHYDNLFHQFIGLQLLNLLRTIAPEAKLYYWKDHNGPEVDYVIEYGHHYLPIEVCYSAKPKQNEAKHILVFLEEYPCILPAMVICLVDKAVFMHEHVIAVNWQEAATMLRSVLFKKNTPQLQTA